MFYLYIWNKKKINLLPKNKKNNSIDLCQGINEDIYLKLNQKLSFMMQIVFKLMIKGICAF